MSYPCRSGCSRVFKRFDIRKQHEQRQHARELPPHIERALLPTDLPFDPQSELGRKTAYLLDRLSAGITPSSVEESHLDLSLTLISPHPILHPLYTSRNREANYCFTLLKQDDYHYRFISSLSQLTGQYNKHYCHYCLNAFSSLESLYVHDVLCIPPDCNRFIVQL